MNKTATLLKFLIPSLIGIFMFLFPMTDADGNTTIPIAYLAGLLLDLLGHESSLIIITVIITLAAILTVIFSWIHKPNSKMLADMFSVTPVWVVTRLLGAIFVLLTYFELGPEVVTSMGTGGMILNDLMPTLLSVFLFAGILLPLLLNYGLLEFVGAIFTKVMRPLFTLPGRSTVDNLASWVGDGTVGVLLSSKQYEDGYYTRREATVIATTFSVVSITFTVVILDLIGLMNYFGVFYLTVLIAGLAAAFIMPRIPPLSRIEDTYHRDDRDLNEEIPEGYNPFTWGYRQAMEKAEKADGFTDYLKDGLKTVGDMWFAVLPIVMAIGTLGTIVAEYTPVFTWIGAPFVPLLELVGIEEAQAASETLFIGFTDMFLPAILIETVASDMTRFVVGALSITQLIYLSEVGGVILGSKIPIGLGKLFIIFLLRTAITLPIIIAIAHIVF